jgi:hypothetical protein
MAGVKINLKDILNSGNLKDVLSSAKTAAMSQGTNLLINNPKLQAIAMQAAEENAVKASGEKAFTFWQKHKKEIIIGGIVGGVAITGLLTWLIVTRKRS